MSIGPTLAAGYFYATPEEVKAHFLDVAGALLSYEETPEALEYRQSHNLASTEGRSVA